MSNDKSLTPEEIQKKIQVTGNNAVPQNTINLKQGQSQGVAGNDNNNNSNANSTGQHGTLQSGNIVETNNNNNTATSLQETYGNIAAEIAAGRGELIQKQAAVASQSPETPQNTIKLLDITSIENQENARLLSWYLNLANPIFRVVENEIISRDADGNEIKRTVTQRVLEGYEYYDVNGVPLKQWIIDTFGPEYKLNTKNNTVEKISNE